MVVESNPGGLSKVGNSNCLNFSSSSTVAIELLVVVVVPLALEYSEEKIISFDIWSYSFTKSIVHTLISLRLSLTVQEWSSWN